jgi:hypothetical protein
VRTTTTVEDMRHVMVLLVAIAVLAACSGSDDEFSGYGRFSGDGRIRGVFHVGNQTVPDSQWVEMIELSGPPEERCGPGDCGLIAGDLRAGTFWRPGRWRVVAAPVRGWISPDPIEIVVRDDELTTFEADYHLA